MCESMCVGSLRMTFVPVEVPKPAPKVRIKPRLGLSDFRVGDKVFNCFMDGEGCYNQEAYTVVQMANGDKVLLRAQYNEVSSAYNCPYVLESETIIENGVRVVGYVNDPCPAVAPPKTMKFDDLPNWCVFTSNMVFGGSQDRFEFIKVNHNTVVYSYDKWDRTYRYVEVFSRGTDGSWGIYNNTADCTIIGNIKFG